MTFSQKLGKRIKELRKKSSLSQDQVAEQAGISGKYLGEVERGEVNVSVIILSKIALVFGVSMNDILTFDHLSTREDMESELFKIINTADEKNIQQIYRIVNAIIK